MNAAARLVHQNVLSRHWVLTQWLSKQQSMVACLIFAVAMSALGTIYVTQVNRDLHATWQHSLLEAEHLRIEHGQLLLERSTWMMQARTQQIAETKLGMVLPDHKSVVIVHE